MKLLSHGLLAVSALALTTAFAEAKTFVYCSEGSPEGYDPAPYTAGTTFDASGRYANATDGTSHAAIYLGRDERGIQVLDQWAGSPAAVRTIPWSNPGGTTVNTGATYRVVVRST